MQRVVLPEWLDTLPPDDPRARRSRADLRRINRITAALRTLVRACDRVAGERRPTQIVELGAGDGHLMRRLARQRAAHWPALHVSLLDLQPTVAPATQALIEASGWTVEVIRADVFAWLERVPADAIVIANLFVHHFDAAQIARLFAAIAERAFAFIACEPRRSGLSLLGSRCLGLLGCNDVTRHDAAVSVRAGFRDRELSAAWPRTTGWTLDERSAGCFLHRFVAMRRGAV